jgi:putative ABC transport system permease protein
MRDRELRRWRAAVRERANHDWRELSAEVVDELATHLADLYASAIERGASDTDAQSLANEALNAASFLELSKRPRARRGSGVGLDVRLAIRQLRATPVVTAVAVLSLALGIGANTAIFSLVNSLVLRALPVKEPQRLAIVTDEGPSPTITWTFPIWQEIQGRGLFAGGFAWSGQRFDLASGGVSQFVDGIWTTAGIFDTLGVTPVLGRGFTADDDRRGGGEDGPVAVISYGFWQLRFGGAADAIGQRLTLERIPFTIVGILPPDFFGPDVGRRIDIAIPMGAEPLVRGAESTLEGRDYWWLSLMVRLRPDQSIADAAAALRGVQPQIRSATLPPEWPPRDVEEHYLRSKFTLEPAATGYSSLRVRYERPLLTIMIVVALVLLIACANIANLLLARANARRHEWSVRLALGASRWRLMRLLLIESLVLSAVGAGLGVLVARWSSQLLVDQLSTQTSTVFLDLSLDWRVLGFTTGIAVLTALFFGSAPAFRAAASAPMDAIKEQGRSGGAESGRLSVAHTLVVLQVALSVVLVVAAALFVRTFEKLASVDLGFDPAPVLVVTMNAQRAQIDPTQRMRVFERALEAVEAVPGVQSAALSLLTPVSGGVWANRLEVSGGVPLSEPQRSALRNQISPRFFQTVGQHFLAGRTFTDADREGAPPVAIVNEAFARRFLNGANPIGHTFHRVGPMNPGPDIEIVGVVADAVYRRLRDPVPPTAYSPAAQRRDGPPPAAFNLNVRTAGGTSSQVTRSIADAIGSVNRDLALSFRPLSDQVNASLTQERIVAMLSGFFGGLALLLAALGLYGVTSYAVSRRRTEIGIRMALGAPPESVIRLVLARVAVLVAIGVATGTAISVWSSQYVSSLLFGLQPTDPTALIGSIALLAAVSAVAGWLPARRASQIDPVAVLRE